MNIKNTAKTIIEEYRQVFDRLDDGAVNEFAGLVNEHGRVLQSA